ncbi:MAG: undecaprenyl-phosphate glucose phosphotransferase [Pseudorhodoplanes sp.]|nr:UDP-glucose:undecaprenyl-phosphate glucose-1-phosphate transferase [Pseudorhodoplanes sp.]MCL4713132.1 undecaprenyl-phosphate glucose phosphotransferase [Pseudorhodoplanes sp.]
MIETNAHNTLSAAPVLAAALVEPSAAPRREAHLSPAALSVIASEPRATAFSPIVVAGIVRMMEFVLINLIGAAVFLGYVGTSEDSHWVYATAILSLSVVAILAFQCVELYDVYAFRRPVTQMAKLVSTWSIVFMAGTAVGFMAKMGQDFSRGWFLGFYGFGLLALMTSRLVLYRIVRRWMRQGRLTRRTVVVGAGEPGERLIRVLRTQPDSDVRVIGVFDDRSDSRSPDSCGGLKKLGTVDDFIEFARRTRVDLVVFSLPISAENRILQMLKKLWVLPVDIRLSAHSNKLRFRPRSYSYLGEVPVIDVFDRPIADWDVVMKWLFDKIIGGLALILLAPLMLLVAIAIKLDSRGPVLFKQKRYGFNNDLIEIYKFRSMYAEAADATAAKLVTKDDPRVTRVGRFIRKASIDELPQLFNVVFKGNLSLVGPRPHAVNAKAEARLYADAVDGYFARHRVKPGVTGWAQINGWRGETDTAEKIQKRVEYDLYYIENWSVLFDAYILAMTPFALLKTENAY